MCSKGTARCKLELHLLPFEPRHGIEQTGVMSRIIINSHHLWTVLTIKQLLTGQDIIDRVIGTDSQESAW